MKILIEHYSNYINMRLWIEDDMWVTFSCILNTENLCYNKNILILLVSVFILKYSLKSFY